MTNKLTQENLDNYIEPYFDMRFEGYVIDTKLIEGASSVWFGFWKDDENILGRPINTINSDSDNWYSSGPHFSDGISLFSLEPKDYYEAMRRYVNKNYPRLDIKKIF